jgi:hypothetical protein
VSLPVFTKKILIKISINILMAIVFGVENRLKKSLNFEQCDTSYIFTILEDTKLAHIST